MSSNDPKQGTLFAGLDCLPGQLDLFPTDGEPESTACRPPRADDIIDDPQGEGKTQ